MLKIAYPYKDKINSAWQTLIQDGRDTYYNSDGYWSYEIALNYNSWDSIEMVSVNNNDDVIRFFKAAIDRVSNKVVDITAISFLDSGYIFHEDFYLFLNNLFTKQSFNKLEWTVVVGNPVEKMYDELINKYNGSIVGINHNSIKLEDGKYYDVKLYELFRENYLEYKT